MIERILPATVACTEAYDDPPDAVLFPEEEAVISRAVDKRRREFRTVRHCARQALGKLGLPPAALLPGERGAPQWPPGVVGSMTHCAGYRAAAVAHGHDLLTIGIDAEPHDVLPPDVLGYVARDEEQAGLAELAAADDRICWDRLLFCIKEAVYKAWFPLTRRWLGFHEASITIDPATIRPAAGDPAAGDPASVYPAISGPASVYPAISDPGRAGHTGAGPAEGRFSARLLVTGPTVAGTPLTGFDGRWLAGDGLVITAIAVGVTGTAPG